MLAHCDFRGTDTYEYTISHKYYPDFIWVCSSGYTYLIESKGRFDDNSESSKYKHIRKHLPENHELVFLFQNHKTPMPRARVKKDGTKTSHGQWATKNDFRWFSKETIEELFNV